MSENAAPSPLSNPVEQALAALPVAAGVTGLPVDIASALLSVAMSKSDEAVHFDLAVNDCVVVMSGDFESPLSQWLYHPK